jgi:guanine nucleotide exchange factor
MSALPQDENSQPSQEMQARLFEALASSSRRARPQGSSLATFQNENEVLNENGTNKYDLLCPRDGCGSVILLKGVAKHVTKESVESVSI